MSQYPTRPRVSAGILAYRRGAHEPEVLIAHPGGPFFATKDDGYWTIPKGQPDRGEDLLAAAEREFFEEVGFEPRPPYLDLGHIIQKGGKIVHAWGSEVDLPENFLHRCNSFEMEWPPRSGRFQSFPEIDRVCFYSVSEARLKLKITQVPLLDRLLDALAQKSGR